MSRGLSARHPRHRRDRRPTGDPLVLGEQNNGVGGHHTTVLTADVEAAFNEHGGPALDVTNTASSGGNDYVGAAIAAHVPLSSSSPAI